MSTPAEPATLDWILSILDILNTLAPGVLALLGVWAGDYFSHKRMVAQISADAENEKCTRRRERLEELYMMFDRWAELVMINHGYYRMAMNGEITNENAYDLAFETSKEVDEKRLFMNAEFYFQEGLDLLSEIKIIRRTLSTIRKEFILKHQVDGKPSDYHADKLIEAMGNFNVCSNNYVALLAAHARKLI